MSIILITPDSKQHILTDDNEQGLIAKLYKLYSGDTEIEIHIDQVREDPEEVERLDVYFNNPNHEKVQTK